MKTRWLVLAAAVLVVAPAFADGGAEGDFELGLYAGYSFMDSWGETPNALNLKDDVLFGGRAGWFFSPRWSIELSLQRLNSYTDFDPSLMMNDRNVHIDSARMNFLFNFNPERSFRPFLTAGYGVAKLDVSGLDDKTEATLNAGGGLRWYVSPKFGLRLDAKWIQSNFDDHIDQNPNDIEVTYGILWSFGGGPPKDTDGDGVSDRKDDCPNTPRGAIVDKKGCPLDGDGDKVFDGIDKCPDTPAGYPVDNMGCSLDSDGDGVPDGADKCPQTPRGATVDSSGCPTDSDGDGVYDGIDKCADTPAGATVDSRGCPKDSDGDGVYDGIDQCPNTPRGAVVDARGCPVDSDGDGVPDGIDECPDTPKGAKVNAKGCEELFGDARGVLVLEGVKFEFNSADLTPAARGVLDRVARALEQNPDVRVEIAGYTDSQGDDDYNLRLSQWRADAVRKYLETKGIAASRMVSKGYGEANPVASNDTEEGREQNRRVALKRLD